jgi:hypothetical protein
VPFSSNFFSTQESACNEEIIGKFSVHLLRYSDVRARKLGYVGEQQQEAKKAIIHNELTGNWYPLWGQLAVGHPEGKAGRCIDSPQEYRVSGCRNCTFACRFEGEAQVHAPCVFVKRYGRL